MGSAAQGTIRAVLVDHLLAGHPRAALVRHDDPNALLPAGDFTVALEAIRHADGDEALRRLARDYVGLWARTFRTLVRHLRGRPERTLSLFCNEFYPFLRGDRRAARVEQMDRHGAHVLLADDLPPAYLAGLLEAFVALSGADATARALGPESFQVRFHLHPRDAAARTMQWVAGLRIPLLLTAALGVLVGAVAALADGTADPWRAAAVFFGAIAAQSGANGLHDLRRRGLGPLDRPRTGRAWKWFQVGSSSLVAAAMLAFLVLTGQPWTAGLAAVGIALGVGYTAVRDHGFGPLVAAVAHGPLVVAGSYWVIADAPWTATTELLLLGAGPGLLTAAMLYLDDMADRPLDEAGGRRTLAVRMPQRRNLLAYAALLTAGVASVVAVIAGRMDPLHAAWMLPSAGIAVSLVRDVRNRMDEPRGLARSRFVGLALHVLTTGLVVALFLTETP